MAFGKSNNESKYASVSFICTYWHILTSIKMISKFHADEWTFTVCISVSVKIPRC